MAEVKSMNTSGVGIVPEITNHPRVVMRGVEKNMTQNVANRVETEVRGEVATRRIEVKTAKSASQCILPCLSTYQPSKGGRGTNLRNARLGRRRKGG
jgi:hypothetical protein